MQPKLLTTAKIIAGLILFVSLFAACKKEVEKPTAPTPIPEPAPIAQELVVQFSNTTLPISDIDSVVVIVRDQNRDFKKWETLQKGSTYFKLNLNGLEAGQYTAEITAYSKQKADLTARQYALLKNLKLPLQQPGTVTAPNGRFSDDWYQRAVFFEGNNAVVTIGMDPRDTYYGASFKEAKWNSIHLQRYSVYENVVVASKASSRKIEGLVGFGEYSDYTPYVSDMNGKSWTKGVINGYVENSQGGGDVGFYYEYYNN